MGRGPHKNRKKRNRRKAFKIRFATCESIFTIIMTISFEIKNLGLVYLFAGNNGELSGMNDGGCPRPFHT